MPREINALTGNYFDRQDEDLHQSVVDRLHVPLGGRAVWPTYGLPVDWPQLDRDGLRAAITAAVAGDEFVDRMGFTYDGATLIVDIETDRREDY